MTSNSIHYWIAGIGRVKIKMFDGIVKTLDEVRYVPNLKRNLIFLEYS